MKNSFLKGFTWLTISGLIAKIFGGFYKIILTNIIGAKNIGIYQQLLPVYSFIIVMTSVGVPLGVSKMLASEEEKEQCFRSTVVLFVCYSTVLALILALLSKPLTLLHGNENFWFVYLLLSPAIVFSSVSAVYKGYFQSMGNFKPTALANVFEQVAKIVVGLGVVALLFSNSRLQISFAFVAIEVGEVVCFLILYFMKRRYNSRYPSSLNTSIAPKKYFFKVVKNVLPIMITGLVLPLSNLVDSFLVVRLLKSNFSNGQSVYLYGLQTGVVTALVNIPSTISFAIISVLMPSLSKDFSLGQYKKYNNKLLVALKLILVITIPCVLFVAVYPKSILELIYGVGINAYGMDGLMISSRLLVASSCGIIFSCLASFFSMCLQARNRRIFPIVNSLVGVVAKLLLEIIFVPTTSLSILSFSIAGVVGYCIIAVLNGYILTRERVEFVKAVDFLKICLATAIALLISILFATIELNNVSFILIVMSSAVVYLALLIKLKILNKKEINYLIKSGNISKF